MRASDIRWRRLLSYVLGIAAMGAMLAWLMGAFYDRVPPGPLANERPKAPEGPRFTVELVSVPDEETAVGTIRAIQETAVSSRILGRIRRLAIERAGQRVERDEVLAELESDDLEAAVEQANAQLSAATTRRDKARIDLDRSEELVKSGVAPPDRLDTDRAAYRAAEAEVERATQAVAAAKSALDFATIRAPIAGIVVDKRVNEGDVVQPGQLICTIYDPTRLQLVASIREELAGRLSIGQPLRVTLDALGKTCEGTVAEIVPDAQASTRSFEVKVTGPCQPNVVTGMFGRLHVPLGERSELQVPRSAVRTVGQLDFVLVGGPDGTTSRRFVRIGRERGDRVEVLSGLAAGEVVLADAGA
ncbi:MAG: efflux RND transporter periplasmic adaptor subunit [Planctomycetota bacterium]